MGSVVPFPAPRTSLAPRDPRREVPMAASAKVVILPTVRISRPLPQQPPATIALPPKA